MPSNPWPESIDYPPEQLSERIRQPLQTFARGLPHQQRKRQSFCNASEKLKVKKNTRSNGQFRGVGHGCARCPLPPWWHLAQSSTQGNCRSRAVGQAHFWYRHNFGNQGDFQREHNNQHRHCRRANALKTSTDSNWHRERHFCELWLLQPEIGSGANQ